jgi:hypothetical protein
MVERYFRIAFLVKPRRVMEPWRHQDRPDAQSQIRAGDGHRGATRTSVARMLERAEGAHPGHIAVQTWRWMALHGTGIRRIC